MAKRHKIWAKVERKRLMMLLGGVCAKCGTDGSEKGRKLEFDCITPQGDRHHKLDTERRICFYRRQLQQNNLQILCEKCNAIKGNLNDDLFNQIKEDSDNIPF